MGGSQLPLSMFSDEDVRGIFETFNLSKDHFSAAPSLILASDGQGFLTFQHLEARFRERITRETQRTPVSSLARDLNVDQSIVRQLVHTNPSLAVPSLDGNSIIGLNERDALRAKLLSSISGEIVLKMGFAVRNDLDITSVDIFLRELDEQFLSYNDYVWSKSYEDSLTESISNLLKRSLEDMRSIEIIPTDLPGTPPVWFILHNLKTLQASQSTQEKFHVQEEPDSIRCAPKQLTEHKRDRVVGDLQSGALAYNNLQKFWKDFPELFASVEDVHEYVQNLPEVEVMDAFAVSRIRIANVGKECLEILRRNGYVELTHTAEKFPDSLRNRIAQRIEQIVLVTSGEDSEPKLHRTGNFILSTAHRDKEQALLLDYAKADASAQWQQLKENPGKEIKFSLVNVAARITSGNSLQGILMKEKLMEKALDEQFWSVVAEQEVENETEFSAFWLERLYSRCYNYNEGLSGVKDQKLCDQLAELLTSYIQKELLPDSVSKARSLGLVLSRRTRKNISKLETVSKVSKADTASILAALDSFNKKQGIGIPDVSRLNEAKKAMVNDMVRRMQKQKQSDGPVLFLTLILILFARHYPGVVYATGKFAPKLLKQLKQSLEPEQYEQLETWKEAAKAGTLTAEERQEMKKMAEA